MATKIVFKRPGGGRGECETEDPVNEIVARVNRALKGNEKFITVTETNDKKRGLVAQDVISIGEK
jgi:hypothetical protein